MIRSVAFKQVDVFAERAFGGNPVAVVMDARGLDGAAMQRIAAWTNLSETTFALPPASAEASYRLRIFTPRQELPFAGHPSVGTAHALLQAGLVQPRDGRLLQECGAGLLPVRIEGEGEARRIFVRAPAAKLRVATARDIIALAEALGAPLHMDRAPRVVDVGPIWLTAMLDSAEQVRALRPDFARLAELTLSRGLDGVTVFGAEGPDATAAYAVRSFAPADGVPEDPVCGSGNAAVAAWLRTQDALGAAAWESSQGREVGRDGRIGVAIDAQGHIEIGGRAITRVDGTIQLD